jgi:hypothetical protein
MKTVLVLLCSAMLSSAAFATSGIKKGHGSIKSKTTKKQVKKSAKKMFGRECCTQEAFDSDGNLISVTACAGWFLSNSLNAYERACDKALAGLAAIVPNP